MEEIHQLPGDACNQAGSSTLFFERGAFDEEKCLTELEHSLCCDELKSVVASVTWENPQSDVLFRGKYLVFVLENLLPWQKPLGEYFQSTFTICAAKPKKLSESENTYNEVFCDLGRSNLGNPLAVQFESLLRQNSESRSLSVLRQLNMKYDFYPLPESIGRKLLYMCTSFENSLKLPFVTVCYGKKPKNIVLTGAYVQDRSFRLKILNQGSVSSLEKLPLLTSLKEAHLEGFSSSLISGSCIESYASARYDFLCCSSEDNSLVPVKDASLAIECSWSDVHAVLESLTPECVCTAKLKTVAGDNETGAFRKFKELQLLKALQQSLNNGVMTWMKPDSFVFVMKEIKDLVNEEKNSIGSKENAVCPKIDQEHLEDVIVAERVPLYFTDKLWLVMKHCSSFEELTEVLRYTYKVLAELLIHQPRTHGKDVSTISKDINNMMEKLISCPNLNHQKAAQLLLEIGVEKMRKDYEQFFLGLELVPRELFCHFIQPDLLSPEAVTGLEKLHSVLELTLVCIKQLSLPKNILSEFARSALKHYTLVPEVDLQHVFSFHIPTIYARPLLNQMRPTVWELSLMSSDKNFLKQSVHRLVTTATHDHIYAPKDYHPKLMLKGASYTYLLGTLVEENVSPDLHTDI